ncbi:CACTA en-spm transposon protein [Cucumis melo var. makuwa]|uniref:CACTA en-spm transposon protein n=1 Tax=Cucumis melo var. makuwa TaxID=1194695 RepID=A0A5A7UWM8_CUCMM|nr:CACTA en-spm transposon protein [Cucumis melo var. makuwa]TYJ97616.1 CACTA en-spm transposon protein [Cucumis melo var. makuwa]
MEEQSRTNKAARQKQPYNHSNGSKPLLQQQHELAEKKGKYSVDDQATQKALVGDPSRRSTRRRVRAVPRRHVRSP